ncbi:MAG TPA: YusW family protein [Candidatus Avamphibacillus sp.]|nr:YusW family protein [Candidatus Avamphibacillus sp.]
MRYVKTILSVLLVSLILVACGGNNDETNQTDDDMNEDTTTNETEQGAEGDEAGNQVGDDNSDGAVNSNDMKEKMENLDYTEFKLEVDYGPDNEFEAEIELENDMVTADLEDEVNGFDLNEKEAFDKIYPNVEKLSINKDTEKEEAITQALEAFDLNSDYEKVELEITFNDGVKIEFEDLK